ncbi:MAG: hypothetical protein M3Z26_06090 [Bacteroidota bacterium]|nr:hypothetical protein [Bacteroidota bacterium]
MKTFRIYIITIFSIAIFYSCTKTQEIILNSNPSQNQYEVANVEAAKFANRNIFGVAFAKALVQNKQLATLIKNVANTKFDGTTDILYWDIMDKSLNGKTVNDYIKQFANNKDLFQKAIDESPLLTIYVPILPSGWNNNNWKSESETPSIVIAKNLLDTKRVMNYYNGEGKMKQISDQLIPGEPTLVIKENARVILKSYADQIKKIYNSESDLPVFYKNLNGKDLYIISARLLKNDNHVPNYDITTKKLNDLQMAKTSLEKPISPNVANPNPFNYDISVSYGYFRTSWPRDYIYYGLTPTNTNGFFNNRNIEDMLEFWFISTAIFPQISTETNDPHTIYRKYHNSDPSWTSGSYLMTFTILVNAKNGIGLTIKKVIAINPQDVWDVTYGFNGFWYSYKTLSVKGADPINLDLLSYDISNYSIDWKISVEDTRPSQTQTITNSYTSTFSENFTLDPTFGLLKKIGLKFGASATQSSTQTHTIATTYTSVELGDIIEGFADPILLSPNPFGPFYDYSTGSVGALIIPQNQF